MAQLTAQCFSQEITVNELRIVMGLWNRVLTIRRECAAAFSAAWQAAQQLPAGGRRRLSSAVRYELVHALCLPPQREFDLRAPASGTLTSSDASLRGGGACFSVGLKQQVTPPVLGELGRPLGNGRDQVGLIFLFSGIGGTRMALEHLGADLA